MCQFLPHLRVLPRRTRKYKLHNFTRPVKGLVYSFLTHYYVGMPRPKKPAKEVRKERIQCVLNKAEQAEIERAAKREGVSASRLLRDAGLKAARRILAKPKGK